MAVIKTPKEIALLQEGGKILGRILAQLTAAVKPGIATWDLELLARQEIKKSGASPAFEGYQVAPDGPPYPAVLCTSVDKEIVHCIPRKDRILKEGEIIGLDLGMKYKGLYTDAAVTVPVGKVDKKAAKLILTTKKALEEGIKQAFPGKTIGDIAAAVQKTAEQEGFAVVRDLVGHGVGHAIHENPNVPNHGKPGTLEKLRVGMVLAIEPMFTTGSHHIRFLDDGWTVVTADGSLAAHFEHTVAITEAGPLILTR